MALFGLEITELGEALGGGVKPFWAKKIFEQIHGRTVADLPDALVGKLAELPLGTLGEASRYESTDGTVRYLLQLIDGKTIETVFIPEEDRDTVCISSQVGCPVDCKFCLTALMGLERNLTAGEIVGQVMHVVQRHCLMPRLRPLNVVLMGQGEPLMNLENVLKATRILVHPRGIGLVERRITLSTSGLIPKMAELGSAAIRPRLAVSLNASNEQQRRQIMPITNKWHLADLIEACRQFPLRTKEKIFFEYVLLGGVNDSDADAHLLVALIKGINSCVNLIPLNPGPGIPYAEPEPERVAAFQKIVMKSVRCYVRKARGQDIYAACGQLQRLVSFPSPQSSLSVS